LGSCDQQGITILFAVQHFVLLDNIILLGRDLLDFVMVLGASTIQFHLEARSMLPRAPSVTLA
jgi:hypothetical protein